VSLRLTPAETNMLLRSAEGCGDRLTSGFGVELRGAGQWGIARRLVQRELGWIEGGRPNGSELPGLFFANSDGLAWVVDEPDPLEEAEDFFS